jgi:hypothetical protein
MNSVKPTFATSPADYIKQIEQPRRAEVVKLDKFIRKTVPRLERFIYGSTAPMLATARTAVNADDSLGKVDLGKGCIRFRRVEDVNLDALATVLAEAARTQAKTPDTAQ